MKPEFLRSQLNETELKDEILSDLNFFYKKIVRPLIGKIILAVATAILKKYNLVPKNQFNDYE